MTQRKNLSVLLVLTLSAFCGCAACPSRDEFVPLFNGRDLAGWIGDTNAYIVQDGILYFDPVISPKGGNLFTEKTYDNFILRFDFKLTPGANNGLAIRSPLQGDPAYVGMEIQILDDDNHPEVKPWQRHGSIYGQLPAIPGHLKPAGQWNHEEVVADGRKITVKLNGHVIVDADLNQVKPMHDANHPGTQRTDGHIGFLGHGSRVDFRNISIKELTHF